jgi:hypothetical protein
MQIGDRPNSFALALGKVEFAPDGAVSPDGCYKLTHTFDGEVQANNEHLPTDAGRFAVTSVCSRVILAASYAFNRRGFPLKTLSSA